jgi:hypothetical protein
LDALLRSFFQLVLGQRDVLCIVPISGHLRSKDSSRLERQLNLTCNFVADDSSFATRAIKVAIKYRNLCYEQSQCVPLTAETSSSTRSRKPISDNIKCHALERDFDEVIAYHSCKDLIIGKCDAIFVIPCSSVTTAMLQHISNINEQEKLLKYFMLV